MQAHTVQRAASQQSNTVGVQQTELTGRHRDGQRHRVVACIDITQAQTLVAQAQCGLLSSRERGAGGQSRRIVDGRDRQIAGKDGGHGIGRVRDLNLDQAGAIGRIV